MQEPCSGRRRRRRVRFARRGEPRNPGGAPVRAGLSFECDSFAAFARRCLPFYAAWVASYELVGRYASQLPATDLSLALDAMIPFQPAWVWVYGLTYVVPFVALAMIREEALAPARVTDVVWSAMLASSTELAGSAAFLFIRRFGYLGEGRFGEK
jgi:hypothetical protein